MAANKPDALFYISNRPDCLRGGMSDTPLVRIKTQQRTLEKTPAGRARSGHKTMRMKDMTVPQIQMVFQAFSMASGESAPSSVMPLVSPASASTMEMLLVLDLSEEHQRS
jgi:hypothetical protein